MKKKLLIAVMLVFTLSINHIYSQGVSINDDGTDPDASAILDLQSENQGLLIPRMTTSEIASISSPADGLQVYCTTDGKLYIFVLSTNSWKEVSFGTGSIPTQSFQVCGDDLLDTRDFQSYGTVEINGQCWMAENLNIGSMTSSAQYDDGMITKSCMYGNPTYCDDYGGLYQWNEMMQYATAQNAQGICPDGWHIPSDYDIYLMENFIDPSVSNPNQPYWRGSFIGGALKEAGYVHWNGPNTAATNASGLTVVGGGYRSYSGSYGSFKTAATLWSSTQAGSYAYYRELSYTSPQVYRNQLGKTFYCSVRCVKD